MSIIRSPAIAMLLSFPGLALAQSSGQPSARSQDQPAHRAKALTQEQFIDRTRGRLLAADTDGDGRISEAEMAGVAHGRGNPSKHFRRLDENQDGYIDKAEMQAAMKRRFARMDRDGDGLIQPHERTGLGKRGAPPSGITASASPGDALVQR